MANAIQDLRSGLQRAKEVLGKASTEVAEAVAKEITFVRLVGLISFVLYMGFAQARHERLANEICNLQMQIQDQQKTQHRVTPTATFQGCLDRLGSR